MAKEIQLYNNGEEVYPTNRKQVVNGTFNSTSVPSGTPTAMASMTLPEGVWVITASIQWLSSFTQPCYLELTNTTPQVVVRGTGSNGGGINLALVENVTAQKTIGLNIYQGSGSSQSINRNHLRAVRIA